MPAADVNALAAGGVCPVSARQDKSMRGLAAFIMHGRLRAILIMALAGLLPLLAWFGGAVLALVTLRAGPRHGALAALAAAAGLALLLALAFGAPQAALGPLLELWLPVFALAAWLRYTVSLSGTVRLATGLAVLGLAGFYLLVPDQVGFWGPVLDRFGSFFAGDAADARQAWQALREQVLPIMAGVVVLTQLALVLVSLLLGRWWQALLYNPGGFRREFHALDLGRGYALAGVLLLAAAMWRGMGLIYDAALVMSVGFVLQALALVHAAVAIKGLGRGWLLALYLLLPFAYELVVVVGIADAAFQWRRRLQEQAGPGGSA
jgi:hypothetical protein